MDCCLVAGRGGTDKMNGIESGRKKQSGGGITNWIYSETSKHNFVAAHMLQNTSGPPHKLGSRFFFCSEQVSDISNQLFTVLI